MQVYDHKHETMALKTSHTPEPQYDHSSDKNISVTIHLCYDTERVHVTLTSRCFFRVQDISYIKLMVNLGKSSTICCSNHTPYASLHINAFITCCQITYQRFLKVNYNTTDMLLNQQPWYQSMYVKGVVYMPESIYNTMALIA